MIVTNQLVTSDKKTCQCKVSGHSPDPLKPEDRGKVNYSR